MKSSSLQLIGTLLVVEERRQAFAREIDHAIQRIGESPARYPVTRFGRRRFVLMKYPRSISYTASCQRRLKSSRLRITRGDQAIGASASRRKSRDQSMKNLRESKLPDVVMQAAPGALRRAAGRARDLARQTGTKLVIVRKGVLMEVDPDDVELDREESEDDE